MDVLRAQTQYSLELIIARREAGYLAEPADAVAWAPS
jgi:hypothetical protein